MRWFCDHMEVAMSFARWFLCSLDDEPPDGGLAHAQSAKAALKDAQGKDVGQVQLIWDRMAFS